MLDDDVYSDGAVGVLLAEDVSAEMVVSQGCRPIGSPYVVTKAEGNVIYELAGRPALERLVTMLEQVPPDDRVLASRGLHCGLVVDERKEQFERGDFLIRAVVGADRSSGAIVVGDVAAVGSTVQFQVRDAASADEDLHELLRRPPGRRRVAVQLQRPRPSAVRPAGSRRDRRGRSRRCHPDGGDVLRRASSVPSADATHSTASRRRSPCSHNLTAHPAAELFDLTDRERVRLGQPTVVRLVHAIGAVAPCSP